MVHIYLHHIRHVVACVDGCITVCRQLHACDAQQVKLQRETLLDVVPPIGTLLSQSEAFRGDKPAAAVMGAAISSQACCEPAPAPATGPPLAGTSAINVSCTRDLMCSC